MTRMRPWIDPRPRGYHAAALGDGSPARRSHRSTAVALATMDVHEVRVLRVALAEGQGDLRRERPGRPPSPCRGAEGPAPGGRRSCGWPWSRTSGGPRTARGPGRGGDASSAASRRCSRWSRSTSGCWPCGPSCAPRSSTACTPATTSGRRAIRVWMRTLRLQARGGVPHLPAHAAPRGLPPPRLHAARRSRTRSTPRASSAARSSLFKQLVPELVRPPRPERRFTPG